MEIILGDGLKLCPIQLDDATALYELTDMNRNYLRNWLPWLDLTTSLLATQKYIELCIHTEKENGAIQTAIFLNNKLVGIVGFHPIDKQNRRAAIGYWVSENLRGRGIAKKASSALITYGFTKLNLHRIVIECAVENYASRRIPEALGFKFEGVLREVEWLYDHFVDHAIYSILDKEWKA